MMNYCEKCGKLIQDRQWVKATVYAEYHTIPSAKAYAFNKQNMEVVSDLEHVNCNENEGD